MKYETADAWRLSAMQRTIYIDDKERALREQAAYEHVLDQDLPSDGDVWDDYQLYIQGKMELKEYQDYLLFKHAGN